MCRCIVVQKKPAVSCQFFWMFPFHCSPNAVEDFDVHFFFIYNMPIWNKFIVDEMLSVREDLQPNLVFALVQTNFCVQGNDCVFFVANFSCTSSIFIVSKRDL
jgi:hypothetical protein